MAAGRVAEDAFDSAVKIARGESEAEWHWYLVEVFEEVGRGGHKLLSLTCYDQ